MSKKEKKEEKIVEEIVPEVNETAVGSEAEDLNLSPELTRILELEEELVRVKKEADEEKMNFMRKNADMDNYRKRLIREKESAVQYANERLINDLIPVIDDFERAIEASSTKDVEGYMDGVKMIRNQLLDVLD